MDKIDLTKVGSAIRRAKCQDTIRHDEEDAAIRNYEGIFVLSRILYWPHEARETEIEKDVVE